MQGQSRRDDNANIPSMQERKDSTNGHFYRLLYPASTESKTKAISIAKGGSGGRGSGEITAGEGDKSHKKETEIKFH